MWILLVEIAGALTALCGWFIFHAFGLLLTGSVLIAVFDALMSSSGGQLKSPGLSLLLLAAGAIVGGVSGYGILTAALLFFSIYSALFLRLKLVLLVLAVMNDE